MDESNCIVVTSIVIGILSWAKPALPKTMHTIDDSELSKITDYDHTKSTEHENHHSKDKQLNKKDYSELIL